MKAMGTLRQPALVTYQEFMSGIHDHEIYGRSEYWDGEIVEKGMPVDLHGALQAQLSAELVFYFRRQPIGTAMSDLHCIFEPGRRVLVPDIAVVLGQHRMAGGPLPRPPDMAIEILSPDDRASRIARKIEYYLSHGVRMVWLLDPEIRRVWVHKPGQHAVGPDGTLSGEDVLPGLEIPVARLFPAVSE